MTCIRGVCGWLYRYPFSSVFLFKHIAFRYGTFVPFQRNFRRSNRWCRKSCRLIQLIDYHKSLVSENIVVFVFWIVTVILFDLISVQIEFCFFEIILIAVGIDVYIAPVYFAFLKYGRCFPLFIVIPLNIYKAHMLRQIMRDEPLCRSSSCLRRRYLYIYILIIFFKRHPQTVNHYRSVIGNREQFLVIFGCQPGSFSVSIKPASEYITGRKRISRLRCYLEFNYITVIYYKFVIVVNLFVIFPCV